MDYLSVLWSFLLLLGLGAILGLLLALAAKFFHVEEDPRIKEVEDMLPHYNCGRFPVPPERVLSP